MDDAAYNVLLCANQNICVPYNTRIYTLYTQTHTPHIAEPPRRSKDNNVCVRCGVAAGVQDEYAIGIQLKNFVRICRAIKCMRKRMRREYLVESARLFYERWTDAAAVDLDNL